MTKQWCFVAALALLAAQPALADEFIAVTPSGQTEALFDLDVTSTSDALASRCIDVGWVVISSTSTVVVCEAPMNTGQQVLGQLLLGNSYSTPPKRYLRFNLTKVENVSRVQASGWVETQMAFGQIQRADFSGPEFHNSAVGFLTSAGGRLPPGTTFPNHVRVGVTLDTISRDGAVVKEVEPEGAAAKAGIQIDDVIRRFAGERIKSEGDWWDGAARAAKAPTYEIEVVRGGKTQKVTLMREFRPPVIAPPASAIDEDLMRAAIGTKDAPRSTEMPPNFSIADEIAKLAGLRDQGLITDEEFERQKARLLEN